MLCFHAPDVILAEKISKVGKDFFGKEGVLSGGGDFPPKKSRDIYKLIKGGDVQGVSLIEWGALFRDDYFWKNDLGSDELDDVILTIFTEVEVNADLRSMVILNAVMTIEDTSRWLPEEIMSRFNLLIDSLKGKDLLCFKLIHSLNNGDYKGLTDSLIQSETTPIELLSHLSWPKFIVMKETLEFSVINQLSAELVNSHSSMVTRFFEQLEGDPLIQLIDGYASNLGEYEYPSAHLKWLKKNVGPGIKNDNWSRINPNTRVILARILNINNFPIFYDLINDLARDCPGLFNLGSTKAEGMSCHQRAVQRMAFWKNYTESMVTSKLLLGTELHRAGGLKIASAPTQLLISEESERLRTNWLIVEFEKVIVLEQLTSPNGAVRIFSKTLLNEAKLLGSSKLTSNDIVLSIQDDLHDHSHLWQSSLEERLRTKYFIRPNSGTKRFFGINIRYTEGVGLEKPPQKQLNSRVHEVERWEKAIIAFEMSLGKYETADALDSLIQARLSAMLKNNQAVVAISQLKQFCMKSNQWAYRMLSSYLLTKSNGTQAERGEGQKLYDEMVNRWGP